MRYVITRASMPHLSDTDAFFNDFFVGPSSKKIPPVDIYSTAAAYVIEAETAGYSEKDIKVVLKDNVLTISTEESWKERREREKERKSMIISEIRLPEFSRSFRLPEDADAENIAAECRNGVLAVTIPRLKPAVPSRIEVKIGR